MSPQKPKTYTGPTKYELILQLKKYNEAHGDSNKLPIPLLSRQSQIKVETLESLEKKRIAAQDAQKEATRLIQDLLALEPCVSEGADLDLDWDGVSQKCKSLMALLEKKDSEKKTRSREAGEVEENYGEGVTMGIETELATTLEAAVASLVEEGHTDIDKELRSQLTGNKNVADVMVQGQNSEGDTKSVQGLTLSEAGRNENTRDSSDADHKPHTNRPSENEARRTKMWQERVHEAAGLVGYWKNQAQNKVKVEPQDLPSSKDKRCPKVQDTRYKAKSSDEYGKINHTQNQDEAILMVKTSEQRAQDERRESEKQKAFIKEQKIAKKRANLLKKFDAEKRYEQKKKEKKEREKKEKKLAQSKMWEEEREKAKLRRKAAEKERRRLSEQQKMARPHQSRSRYGSSDSIESKSPLAPVDHILVPTRRFRSSDARDTNIVSSTEIKCSEPKARPHSPEVHFTPSTKFKDHDDKTKDCTRFPKWLSKTPKPCSVVQKYTKEEKEKKLKKGRENAERLHSEVNKHTRSGI